MLNSDWKIVCVVNKVLNSVTVVAKHEVGGEIGVE